MVQIYSGRPCQTQASSEQLTCLLRAPRAGFAAQCLTYCSFLEPKALKTHRALSHHAGCEAGPVELGFCTVPTLIKGFIESGCTQEQRQTPAFGHPPAGPSNCFQEKQSVLRVQR